MVVLIVTSLLRHRLGLRTWRAVHWIAYACWPLALAHGFGNGTDGHKGWMLVVLASCLLSVVAAVVWRVTSRHFFPNRRSTR